MALGAVTHAGVWRVRAERTVRRLAAVSWAGALLGLLVGGVGSRLGMMLLAKLNPQATGVTSDDGFTMGQFTVANTVNLLVVGTLLGVIGAGIYGLLRGLRIGPCWFQVLSVAVGPAVVVGAVIVNTDGVDFRLLTPTWLAIALFVAIPGLYAGLLTLLGERVLVRDGWWARRPLPLALAPLLLWLPVFPVLVLLVAVWAADRWLRRTSTGTTMLDHPAARWAARLGLAVIFAVALLDLGNDTAELI